MIMGGNWERGFGRRAELVTPNELLPEQGEIPDGLIARLKNEFPNEEELRDSLAHLEQVDSFGGGAGAHAQDTERKAKLTLHINARIRELRSGPQ